MNSRYGTTIYWNFSWFQTIWGRKPLLPSSTSQISIYISIQRMPNGMQIWRLVATAGRYNILTLEIKLPRYFTTWLQYRGTHLGCISNFRKRTGKRGEGSVTLLEIWRDGYYIPNGAITLCGERYNVPSPNFNTRAMTWALISLPNWLCSRTIWLN